MSIGSGWPTVQLSNLASSRKGAMAGGPFGSDLVSRDYVENGVPVVRGTNLPLNSRFSCENFVYVSPGKADTLHLNCGEPGDLVFTQRGTLGQVGILPVDTAHVRFLISQSQMKMTVDKAKACPAFIYYYFRLRGTVSYIESIALQAGVPHINLGILRKFPIVAPPADIQRKIAAVLSAYDDLIENNRRRIALLERMAEQIYREWFVRFRFPGYRLTNIQKGVPAGWHLRKLPALAEIAYGFPFAGNRFNTEGLGKPIVRIRNVPAASTSDFTDEVASDKYLIRSGDLLIGMDGEFHMNHWHGDEAYLVQRVCRIRAKKPEMRAYLYWALRAPIKHLEATIVGATVAHLGAKHLNAIDLLVPEGAAQGAFEPLNDLLDQKLALARINERLAKTRDLLLPRLISGKLRVDDLDIQFPPSMQAEHA